jgi:twitching motility protein PilT
MAAIDSLLGILQLKNADGMVLATDEVPALLMGGARTPLTMPALSGSALAVFVEELLGPELRAALDATGGVETRHQLGGEAFSVRVKSSAGKTTLTLKKGGVERATAPPASRPAPRPMPAASPPPAPLPPRAAPESFLGDLLARAEARGASDVILSPGLPPTIRVDGTLLELREPALSDVEALLGSLLTEDRRRQLASTGSVDLSVTVSSPRDGEPLRARVNLFRHAGGVAAAVRPIWREVPSLEALNLPATLVALLEPRNGLVLVAGPTGAGKSTTLAALLEHVNRSRACHVITLEDPIEYQYPRRRAVIHQREVGTHVDSFASGLRAALREAPDIILVGELRDPATIRLALVAAETGHLVLATVHAGSAAMAVGRMVDAFSESERAEVRQQLAGATRMIVTQQLVPATAGGRIPVLEVVAVNHAVASQIRDGRTHLLGTQIELGADAGMVAMERALADLVRAGRITRAAALDAAADRTSLARLLDERAAAR